MYIVDKKHDELKSFGRFWYQEIRDFLNSKRTVGCKPPGRGRNSGGRELHDEAVAHQGHCAAVHHRVAGRLAGLERDERLGCKPPGRGR